MGKCAIIGAVCPETADAAKKLYCPHWADSIPEVERDGSGRIIAETYYRGCYLRRQVLYQLAVTVEAAHSSKAYAQAREVVLSAVAGGEPPVLRALVELGLLSLAGERRGGHLGVPANDTAGLLGDGPHQQDQAAVTAGGADADHDAAQGDHHLGGDAARLAGEVTDH